MAVDPDGQLLGLKIGTEIEQLPSDFRPASKIGAGEPSDWQWMFSAMFRL